MNDIPQLLKLDLLDKRLEAVENALLDQSVAGTFKHVQLVPSATWVITHNLGYSPNVRVVETGGDELIGQVTDLSVNELTISFFASGVPVAVSGEANLS